MSTRARFTPREPSIEEIKLLWDSIGAVLDEVEHAAPAPDAEQ